MRWNTKMSRGEIRSAIEKDAREAWGSERLPALSAALEAATIALWKVMQVPLDPLSEEPDLPSSSCPDNGS